MFATHSLLIDFLAKAAETRPEAPAVRDAHHALSYQALLMAAARIARTLRACGVSPGDRVLLSCPNSVGFVVAYWGIVACGAVAVPLNPGTPVAKLAFVLKDCTPAAVIGDPNSADTLRAALAETGQATPLLSDALVTCIAAAQAGEVVETLPAPQVIDQDLATLIYTSGSTGTPKGVMLSHLNMTSAARSVASYLGYSAGDRIFCAVPMTFDYGLHQITMGRALWRGSLCRTGVRAAALWSQTSGPKPRDSVSGGANDGAADCALGRAVRSQCGAAGVLNGSGAACGVDRPAGGCAAAGDRVFHVWSDRVPPLHLSAARAARQTAQQRRACHPQH